MDRPNIVVSRPPHSEPPLDDRGRSGLPPRASDTEQHRRAPLRSPRPSAHDGRSTGAIPRNAATTARHTAALRFTEHALRIALEVLDRRRSSAQLRGLLDPALIDALRSRASGDIPARRLGTANLGKVHLQPVDDMTIEVFATYNRGGRVFAVAGRLSGVADSWHLTALQVG